MRFTVLPGNTGPGSGHNSIDEAVTVYDPFTGMEETGTSLDLRAYPNPASEHLVIDGLEGRSAQLTMTDARGAVLMNEQVPEGMEQWTVYLERLSIGNYLVMLTGDGIQWSRSIVLR